MIINNYQPIIIINHYWQLELNVTRTKDTMYTGYGHPLHIGNQNIVGI